MYNREQIDRVRMAVDIVDVIRGYVPSLKASGRSVKGLCPFHTEKTPSFLVHGEKGVFKCFGCGESGDVIAFVSKIENVSFSEALESLAEKAGIVLKSERITTEKQPESVKDQLFRLLERACDEYERLLWNSSEGEDAVAYLKTRGISDSMAQKFRLGVAPSQKSVFETLVSKGFSIDLCRQAGLVNRSQAGRFYDPLYGRLIFPIFDNFGHTVGFGGRVLPKSKKRVISKEFDQDTDEAPKYINSPDSPVFSKGRLLYGLFQGKDAILKSRRVVIFEGYMDVVGAHQGGFTEGVATLGTALTRDHTHLIRRYCDDVVAFFDPDEAGFQAAVRGIEPILKEGLFPRVAVPVETKDPDEIILEKGLDYFRAIVDQAPDFVDFLVDTRLKSGISFQEKAQFARSLVKLIAMSPDSILQTEWLKRTSAKLTLDVSSLDKELAREGAVKKDVSPQLKKVEKRGYLASAEEELIELFLQEPGLIEKLGIDDAELTDLKCRQIFLAISGQVQKGQKVSVAGFIDQFSEDVKAWLIQITLDEKKFSEPSERAEQLVKSIRMQNDRRRLSQLNQVLASGNMDLDTQQEYKQLLQRLKGSAAVPILE